MSLLKCHYTREGEGVSRLILPMSLSLMVFFGVFPCSFCLQIIDAHHTETYKDSFYGLQADEVILYSIYGRMSEATGVSIHVVE